MAPIYSYVCDTCGREAELIRKLSDRDDPEPCYDPKADPGLDGLTAPVTQPPYRAALYIGDVRKGEVQAATAEEREVFTRGYCAAAEQCGRTATTIDIPEGLISAELSAPAAVWADAKKRYADIINALGEQPTKCEGQLRRVEQIEHANPTSHFWMP